MKTLNNLLTKTILPIVIGSSILSSNIYGQINAQRDTSKNILKEVIEVGKKLDSLQDNAIEKYNNAKINFNNCLTEEKNDLPCFKSLLEDIYNSKNTLEEYLSIFENSKLLISENNKSSEGYEITDYNRDLSIEETKDFIKNEELILKHLNEFLNIPSKRNEEKVKIIYDQLSYTTRQANSYFPKEGTMDLSNFFKQ